MFFTTSSCYKSECFHKQHIVKVSNTLTIVMLGLSILFFISGCTPTSNDNNEVQQVSSSSDIEQIKEPVFDEQERAKQAQQEKEKLISNAREKLNLTEYYQDCLMHGEKTAPYQKYIMLHDTEGNSNAQSVIDWWASNGNLVGAHFVINKDGSIWQAAPLDTIVHHAGFGNTGHNALYGTEDESRDDKLGTKPIGSWASDYGMNSFSIGIEIVHIGGEGDYPLAQLQALDSLIAYIDSYYGFKSEIIDHKAWRSGNSDTSQEFSEYLSSYQNNRVHSS